ncbi:MAG: gamma-glutamyltranspeptidase/glutathione hydrolase, partial [Arenicella sp.]
MNVCNLRPVSKLFLTLALLLLNACVSQLSSQKKVGDAAYAMPDRYAATTVEAILLDGGNAVDASVAAAFVLAVTFPEAGNIGGGGFMLAHMDGQNHFLDYREKAPLSADRDMYLDANGEVIEKSSLVGIRAAGVPGTVAGLWKAHQKFGSKPWASLVAPAIAYAEQGFQVHPKKAKDIVDTIAWFDGQVNFVEHFADM